MFLKSLFIKRLTQASATLTSAMDFSIPLSKDQEKNIFESIASDKEDEVYRLMSRIDSKYDMIYWGNKGDEAKKDKTSINAYIESQDLLTSEQKEFLKNLAKRAPDRYINSIIEDLLKLLQINKGGIPEPTKQIELPMQTLEPEPEIEPEASAPHHVPILLNR